MNVLGKIVLPKGKGGMGFRNLFGFNNFMLWKQSWKLISDPDALISKIFKAKYYQKEDFVNAKLGHNYSFSWRSIWCFRPFLANSLRRKVGDENDIKVWETFWFRDLDNPCIKTPRNADLDIVYVSDLMMPDERAWNVDLVVASLQIGTQSKFLVFHSPLGMRRIELFGPMLRMVFIQSKQVIMC